MFNKAKLIEQNNLKKVLLLTKVRTFGVSVQTFSSPFLVAPNLQGCNLQSRTIWREKMHFVASEGHTAQDRPELDTLTS